MCKDLKGEVEQDYGPAAAAESHQSCPTLCDPTDGSPPGSSAHGIFQARVLEWGATAFSETTAPWGLKGVLCGLRG